MGQIKHRVDMTQSKFPLISNQLGETVLVSNTRAASSAETPNTPQVQYMHNVMPSINSLDSVGFRALVPAFAPAVATFTDIRDMKSDLGNTMKLGLTNNNTLYAIVPGGNTWTQITSPGAFTSDLVTIGTVNGVSYIWFPGIGCYQFDEGAGDLAVVVLTGISIPNTIGLVGSSGHLVAYTIKAAAWSSTLDATDFTPSTVTGAGGANVDDIGGDIIFAASNDLGILFYCAENVVAATFTGNVQFPFKFRAVNNSKGCTSQDLAAYEVNSSEHFVYSPAGVQGVTSQKARALLPEVTDFLGGRQFEDFNESTNLFTVTDLVATMQKKVKFVAGRYVIFSYGITEFTHALIYDVALDKVGKVKVAHVDCMEFVGDQQEPSKESIAFLANTGAITTLDFSDTATTDGVLVIGKYQFSRTRNVGLHEVRTSLVRTAASFTVTVFTSLDGETISSTTVYTETLNAALVREFKGLKVGKNHSVLFKGRFALKNVVLVLVNHGRR